MANLMNYNNSSKPENQLLDYIVKEYKGGDLTPEKAEAVECILQDFFKQFPDTKLSRQFLSPCIGFYSKPCIMRGTSVHTNHFVRGDQTTVNKVETEFQGYLKEFNGLLRTEFEGGCFVPVRLCFTPENTHVFNMPKILQFEQVRGAYGMRISIPYNLPEEVIYL